MNDITPDIPPFQIGKAPVRKALQNLPPPSEEEVNFLKSIESWKASEQTVRWFLARSLFKQNDLTESSEQKLEEAATSSILGEQTFTVHAPDSRPTLSLATEWFERWTHLYEDGTCRHGQQHVSDCVQHSRYTGRSLWKSIPYHKTCKTTFFTHRIW